MEKSKNISKTPENKELFAPQEIKIEKLWGNLFNIKEARFNLDFSGIKENTDKLILAYETLIQYYKSSITTALSKDQYGTVELSAKELPNLIKELNELKNEYPGITSELKEKKSSQPSKEEQEKIFNDWYNYATTESAKIDEKAYKLNSYQSKMPKDVKLDCIFYFKSTLNEINETDKPQVKAVLAEIKAKREEQISIAQTIIAKSEKQLDSSRENKNWPQVKSCAEILKNCVDELKKIELELSVINERLEAISTPKEETKDSITTEIAEFNKKLTPEVVPQI